MSVSIECKRLQLAIYEYLQAVKMATPPQVVTAMGDLGFDVNGGDAIGYNSNLYFITNISFILATAITGLLDEGLIHLEIISPILQLIDRTIPGFPFLKTRQLNYLIEHWGDAAWIKEPMWIPVVLMPEGTSLTRLVQEPITPKMLQMALDSADAGHIWQERFESLVSEKVGAVVYPEGE